MRLMIMWPFQFDMNICPLPLFMIRKDHFIHDSLTFQSLRLNISLSCMLHSFKSSAASTLVVASHIKSFIHGAFSVSAHEDHGKWSMVIYRQGFFPMWYSEYKLKRQLKRQNVFSVKDVMQNILLSSQGIYFQ